ncbi:MAG: AMP-binding protein [Pseudomonadota bacterium]|nr:AMP-binding protein [Pseudomonadota bacterium]
MSRTMRSYFHRGGETPLLGQTIAERLTDVSARFPDREAVVSIHQGRRLTYAGLQGESDRIARGLLALGFAKGERVGVWSTNNVEWLLLQLATARIGVILVNINPAYRVRELKYALRKSEVQGLFLIPRFRSSDYTAMLGELLPQLEWCCPEELTDKELPDLRRLILYDPAGPERTRSPLRGLQVWQDLLAAAEGVPPARLEAASAALDPDDPINIQYTSGTTGFPKAVLLTHHNILNNAWFSAAGMGFTAQDRLAVPVPFYHCFGMVLANMLCLSVGACLVLPSEHFDPLAVLRAIQSEGCTAVHGVPTMFIAQLEHPEFARFDLASLRTGIMAGAPCPPALMTRVMEDMHCPEILIGYGETEASPLTHLTLPDDSLERRTRTVGRNLPHQEVKIVDLEDGRTLPINEIGEVCFRGYHVMRGYYRDPEATAESLDTAGWLHSGDLGRMDEEGYLTITGRLKEMIIRGGENIYPREIEEHIFAHPKVALVAVFGVPDPFYGEEVAAWIQPHAGATMSAEEVRDHCRDLLAHFKIPKHIRLVDQFPMTVTGKLQKFRMREREIELQKKDVPP